jgi:hypothetical protein
MAITNTFTSLGEWHQQIPENVQVDKIISDMNTLVTAINANITIVDTSMYYTAKDTSIWSWKITKV